MYTRDCVYRTCAVCRHHGHNRRTCPTFLEHKAKAMVECHNDEKKATNAAFLGEGICIRTWCCCFFCSVFLGARKEYQFSLHGLFTETTIGLTTLFVYVNVYKEN